MSTDHGATWQVSPLNRGVAELGGSGNYWHLIGQGGVTGTLQETRDCGITWTTLDQDQLEPCLGNTSPTNFWRVGASHSVFYAQGYNFNTGVAPLCVSSDNGQSWTPGPAAPGLVKAVRGEHWFAISSVPNPAPGGSRAVQLLRSDDQGQTWQSTGLYSASTGLDFITFTAQGPTMCVIATNQVPGASGQSAELLWLWDDARATWTAAPPFPSEIDPNGVNSLAVNPTAPQEIFLSRRIGGVFVSRDAGVTWADVSVGLPGPPNNWSLLFDPSLPNRLYAWMTTSFWALDISQ